MPNLSSPYRAFGIFRNPHVQTIFANIARFPTKVPYRRERLTLPDGDFVDLDWSENGNSELLITLHGLEGSSDRPYIRGVSRYAQLCGLDVLGFNFRGCSGEPNVLLRSYHSGETNDLRQVLAHVKELDRYSKIHLVGFSLGGNVVLKFAGEEGSEIDPIIGKIVSISAPVDLHNCSIELEHWKNWIYMTRFMIGLRQKVRNRREILKQGLIDIKALLNASNFSQFDSLYTAPAHGFRDAIHYWTESSSLPFLSKIKVPTLLLNALDDTFLGNNCYPYSVADENPHLHLETPKHGGHVGFVTRKNKNIYYSDKRAIDFILE